MKKSFITTALLAVTLTASAQQDPLWMRYPAISPDGETIAFAYKGDLYRVPAQGGVARQLTTHSAYDTQPVWSPDGKKIAFASAREGSLDVYVVDAQGGVPTRLTTHSGNERPVAFLDNEHVLFTANIMPTAQSNIFAGDFAQIYEVSTNGGRPKIYSAITMENLSINQKGQVLYHDKKGYEDAWRKHHQSPITRDIWMTENGKFQKLTSFKGEDRNPVWAADQQSFYYLSEQDGTFNIYHRNLATGKDAQVTRLKGNPARFLTAATSGKLCFGYNGEIYTVTEGQEPQKVNISIVADNEGPNLVRSIRRSGATEIALAPSGKEIAFIMHGDVYVTSTQYRTTKQITDTPEQERSVSFSPDGRSLVYAAERNGVWQIYRSTIKDEKEKQFTYCTDIEEEQLVKTGITSLQPQYSPDGKEIAFFEDRATLRILNLKSKEIRTVLDGKYNYSYSDGDIWFEWSPDSRWLLASYLGTGGWNNTDIALVNADGKGEIHNLTDSGYSDGNGKWVLDGKAMLFQSDRAGYRSHGSRGAEDDAYLMFFDLDAYNRFRMSKEEIELADANKDVKEKKEEEKKEDKKKKADKKAEETGKIEPEKVKALELDLDNCRDRVVRITVNSSNMGDALLSPKGDMLYYQAAFEDGYDLWKHDLKENRTSIVLKGIGYGGMIADKDFQNIYLCGNGIKKVGINTSSTSSIDFEANFNYKPAEERQYLFNHIWRQVRDKFYDPNIHGVDWEGYRKTYERFLPYINNNYDFSEMLSEMLGELNASHTGCRYYPNGASLSTAALGVFLDNNYEGDGLKIEEVIKRGPFAVKKTGVTAGCIIEQIDGTPVKAGMDYNYLLDGKVGKNVRLTIKPAKGKSFDVTIKPISQGAQQQLLYKRWVDRNRQLVDSLSGGRIAYVHVKAMNSESFRTVYSELLSDKNRNREAVIVDERHNGGGWLHDDLCTLLSGKEYQQFVPNGKFIGRDPFNKWTKPSCVLICEDDYSNGHGFPWVYKELGIGKLIGAPVAGTMTAVWWETLMDRSLVFGIPQVGCRDLRGNFGENTQLNPDIEVYNTPEDYLNGHDTQLERAVKEMMK